MPSLRSCATLLALASASIASPTYTREQKKSFVEIMDKRSTFTVKQIANSKGVTKSAGPVAMAKALSKFGATIPDNVMVAAQSAASGNGTVAANPEDNDVEYLSPVTVGGTVMELDFDTGSADLWVFSSLLPSSEQSGHAVYTASNGSGKLQTGQAWKITYGDNSGASGQVYADKVVVGGVTATSQAVEAATSVSTQFTQDQANDGLLGLAFSSINTITPNPATTFFDTVKANLAQPLFTANLKKGTAGSYDFGFIDNSKYTGDITYVNVDDSQGFWEFSASGYTVGTGSKVTANIDAIMDTGTSLWFLPTDAVEAYYKGVSGAQLDQTQGGYTFPCSATLPDMSVDIGGATFTVSGDYINYATVSGSTCFGGIQENSGVPFSIFGDIFMKSKFVVFEANDQPRLGIANQASNGTA